MTYDKTAVLEGKVEELKKKVQDLIAEKDDISMKAQDVIAQNKRIWAAMASLPKNTSHLVPAMEVDDRYVKILIDRRHVASLHATMAVLCRSHSENKTSFLFKKLLWEAIRENGIGIYKDDDDVLMQSHHDLIDEQIRREQTGAQSPPV